MTTLKTYKQQFDTISGDNLIKVKTLIERNMDQWVLEDESLLIDLLDDRGVTAEDIVDTLTEMVACEEGNAAFKNAVLAMHLGLEKSRLSLAKLVEIEEAFADDQDQSDNDVSFLTTARGAVQEFALAS